MSKTEDDMHNCAIRLSNDLSMIRVIVDAQELRAIADATAMWSRTNNDDYIACLTPSGEALAAICSDWMCNKHLKEIKVPK